MFVDPQTTNLNFASSSANLKFTSFVIPLPEGTGKGAVMQRAVESKQPLHLFTASL